MTNRNYFLTPGAVNDIRDIGDWSLDRWGKEKTVQYLTAMHEALNYLSAHYKVFQHNTLREDLSGGTGLLLHPIGKHYVVYVPIGEESIAVAAFIRQGRDIPSILQKDGFTIRRELQDINHMVASGLIVPQHGQG